MVRYLATKEGIAMKYRAQRLPSDLGVTVVKSGDRQSAEIVNVSETGLLLRGVRGLGQGDRIDLIATSLRLSAKVVRLDEGGAGLRFLRALSRDQLVHLRRAVGHRARSGGAAMAHGLREM